MMAAMRRLPSISAPISAAASLRHSPPHQILFFPFLASSLPFHVPLSLSYNSVAVPSSCSDSGVADEPAEQEIQGSGKKGHLKSGLYLVGTPIGNLEDITLRALRVLKSADVILSEDTRHSGKLLQFYGIKTSLMSYHKYNESQRERTVLRRLQQGEIVALISDAGTPGISDPGMELVKLCAKENIPVVPIPGPSAVITAISASGLPMDEFTFVGFLPKHASSRRERLMLAANQTAVQIFFVPPHKLLQFLEETSLIFSESRQCVIAREMTKIHEEVNLFASFFDDMFWRGTLREAKEAFLLRQPKGEITVLVEGNPDNEAESPPESQIEDELRSLITSGHSLSMAVKLVAEGTSVKRKEVYSLALRKFGKQLESQDD
ncbi:Ribosomal RNA small subunit methyltransferase I-like protein [Drosera capensis]